MGTDAKAVNLLRNEEVTQQEATPTRSPRNQGHGHRLTAAFEVLENFPALSESRDRVLHLVGQGRTASTSDMVAAIESDVALVIAILRLSNRVAGKRQKIAGVGAAVTLLKPHHVEAVVSRSSTFDFFERTVEWDGTPDRFRLHAVATQRVSERIARESDFDGDTDALLVSALLHDIGKLVLMHAYEGYPRVVHGTARTPGERMVRERRELGVDHALVGGVLARRWGLPTSLASAIERHHSDDASGEAAVIRLADMLAHYVDGSGVNPDELLSAARSVGMSVRQVREILYDMPLSGGGKRRVSYAPSPLSPRETDVLRELSTGKVYDEIAAQLELSTSTVRTHLHNIYGKLAVKDRAQAVLTAVEHGWI